MTSVEVIRRIETGEARCAGSPEALLNVTDLKVVHRRGALSVTLVDGVSFSLSPGETLGVVGESGSGKSVTFLTLMGLVDRKQAEITGEARFKADPSFLANRLPDREARVERFFLEPAAEQFPFALFTFPVAPASSPEFAGSGEDAGATGN